MKKFVLFILLILAAICCNAQSSLSGYRSYNVKGIYQLDYNGNYIFNGKRYSEYKITSNETIDCPLGKKWAPCVYQMIDPEGDDLDLILVFEKDPPHYVANSYGIVLFHYGYVEKPQSVKGLEQYPDRYYVSFRKWYLVDD